MQKIGAAALFLALIVSLGLSVYGSQAWYFPIGPASANLVAPVIGLGILLAVGICLKIPASRTSDKVRKPIGCLAAFVFVPLLLWEALGIGAPALILKLQGANDQVTVTVRHKDDGGRYCRREIGISEHSSFLKENLCVSVSDFERLQVGQKVLLTIRKNKYGVRVFSIEPNQQADSGR